MQHRNHLNLLNTTQFRNVTENILTERKHKERKRLRREYAASLILGMQFISLCKLIKDE